MKSNRFNTGCHIFQKVLDNNFFKIILKTAYAPTVNVYCHEILIFHEILQFWEYLNSDRF